MEVDLTQIISVLGPRVAQFFDQSLLWLAVKFFLFVYSVVLLADVVMLLMLKGLSTDLKTALYGTERPLTSRNAYIKRFEDIRARLGSANPSQYKVAILEADALADEILDGIGYSGATMADKLLLVQGGQLETKELLAQAHEARNQIIHDPHFSVSREEASVYIENFKKFFEEVELF